MKLDKKILSALLVSACFLSQKSAYAAPVNVYAGTSTGFQRGWGSLDGGTFFDGGMGATATVPYFDHMGQSDPVGDLFFEVDAKVTHCFSMGLRPYYHLNSFESRVTRNSDLSEPFGLPAGGFRESVEFSVRRRHAYGLLFVPKVFFKEMILYGLFGTEFSRFKPRINRTLIEPLPGPVTYLSFSKGVSSSAAVVGLGVSREIGNWSLFAEGQYKLYQRKKFAVDFTTDGAPTSQFLKFAPQFASVMVGVKYKLA